MTPKKKVLLIEAIKVLLDSQGYVKDSYGNYKKTEGQDVYRYKFEKTCLRKEVKGSFGWIRIVSGYYKDLSIIDNKIHGLTR